MHELIMLLNQYSDFQITLIKEREYSEELVIEVVFVKDNQKVQLPFRMRLQDIATSRFVLEDGLRQAAAALKVKGH